MTKVSCGKCKTPTASRWRNRNGPLSAKGFLTSPVYAKTRWYEKAAELSSERAAFQKEVGQLMDDRYIARLQALRSLPSVIEAELFAEKLAAAEAACSPQAVQLLKDYGRLWNLSSK